LEPDEVFVSEYKSRTVMNTVQSRSPLFDQVHRAASACAGLSKGVDIATWVALCRKAGIIGKELSMFKVSTIFLEILEARSPADPEPQTRVTSDGKTYIIFSDDLELSKQGFVMALSYCFYLQRGSPEGKLREAIVHGVDNTIKPNIAKIMALTSK
jgi:hypothetical protein